jgi:hypothetical protein
VPTKVEPDGKVFPTSDRAADVRAALLRRLKRSGCTLAAGEPLVDLVRTHTGFRLVTPKQSAEAEKVVLATDGQSYPACGTTGDGYRWAAALGHRVVPPHTALVPVTSHAPWVRALQGITLPDVVVEVVDGGQGGGGAPLYQWASQEIASKVLDHIKTLPEKVYSADPKHGINEAFSHPADQEGFIRDLVAAHLEDKRVRRAAKTKLLFKLKSDAGTDVAYRTLKAPYSEQAAEFVRKKYGDDLLEIINETLAKE